MKKTIKRPARSSKRRFWSPLSGERPMSTRDRNMFWLLIAVVVILFMVIWGSRPPQPIN